MIGVVKLNSDAIFLKVKKTPDSPWELHATRTLDEVEINKEPVKRGRYGGRTDRNIGGTGFFRTVNSEGRWWLVDPDGYLCLHIAVVSVRPNNVARGPMLEAAFGSEEGWAEQSAQLLFEHGFNGTGAWTNDDLLRRTEHPPVYTVIWNFMGSFGKELGITYQKPGHYGYPNDCVPVFHPDFPAHCERMAEKLHAYRKDPYLLGHFSDNEMPARADWLDQYLALDESHPALEPNRREAERWLSRRKGRMAGLQDVTESDRYEFFGYVWDTYFRIVSAAIKRVDPNHMYLGSRFHDFELTYPITFSMAGRYLDAVAVNYYRVWSPDQQAMQAWSEWAGKPLLITEWYVKADDSGLANTMGAGWIVETQEDRGRFYQHFTLGLLESKVCIGWHWFKYMDNDPDDFGVDPSNTDGNKGIVNNRFVPYEALLARMAQLNRHVYELADRFDRSEGGANSNGASKA